MKRRTGPKRPLDDYPRGPALWVSEIVEQVYCETRVALWLKDPGGRVSVPKQLEGKTLAADQEQRAQDGRILHGEMTVGSSRITEDQLQKRIRAGKQTTVLEMALAGSHRAVPIVGRADAVCLVGRKATCAIDYKFAGATRLFPSTRLQLLIYGFLLQQVSVATDDLLLVAALVAQHDRRSFEQASRAGGGVPDAISEAARTMVEHTAPLEGVWYGPGPRIALRSQLALQVFRYDSTEAVTNLDVCMSYWLGEREARPTSNPNRCKQCKYNQLGLCAVARAAYQPRKGG